ncbi:MAG: hypothetical protein JNL42_07775 [Anaerolineae bacterium]|nr:hypothetical protein [Anaerolineae bacterium]
MWGRERGRGPGPGQAEVVRMMVVAMVIAIVVGTMVARGGFSFGGWWWFVVFIPIFMGWSRRSRRREGRGDAFEDEAHAAGKRKNDEDDDLENEKPKHTEFVLGDDGELIEVAASDDRSQIEESSEASETDAPPFGGDRAPLLRQRDGDRPNYV